jgi:hypothetical protein
MPLPDFLRPKKDETYAHTHGKVKIFWITILETAQ